MKTETRRRAEILGELENIPFAVQGKICENRKKLADGRVAVYHNLQWWQDGKNHSIHIPENRLAEFEEAVRGGKRAKELLMELSRCDAQAVLSADSTSKKSPPDLAFATSGGLSGKKKADKCFCLYPPRPENLSVIHTQTSQPWRKVATTNKKPCMC